MIFLFFNPALNPNDLRLFSLEYCTMKHTFFLMIVSLGLAACSHKPPQPHGKFFAINGHETVSAKPLMDLNNQPLEPKHE